MGYDAEAGQSSYIRPDQRLASLSRAGSGPAPQTDVIRAREVIVSGPSGGLFVYNAALTVLQASIVGAPTTDPVLGVTCPQGIATYNAANRVINLLSTAPSKGAFFQYRDRTGIDTAQGILLLSVASIAGTDPVTGTSYPVGLFGIDFGFGSSIQTTGAIINLSQVAYSRAAEIFAFVGGGAANPGLKVDAPEQGVATHMQMLLQGTSPDGTSPAQAAIGPVSGSATLVPQTPDMLEVQGGTGQTVAGFLADAAATLGLTVRVLADTNPRWACRADGRLTWGSGSAVTDVILERLSANRLSVASADFTVRTAGRGLQVNEGANGKQGTATLVAGTVTVANTGITANSRIFTGIQTLAGVATPQAMATSRVVGTSFTITSASAADTSTVAFEIFEPG